MNDVLKNRFNESSDSENLPEGHLERFSKKLDTQMHKSGYSRLILSGYAAAIAVLVVILSVVINRNSLNSTHLTILSLEDVEMIETEQYFQNEIDQRIAVINRINDTQKNKILADIKEFDSSLKKLQHDYNQTPGDSRIVNAVLTTYMMKIEALDKIMNILQKHS